MKEQIKHTISEIREMLMLLNQHVDELFEEEKKNNDELRDLAVKYAWSFLGRWYKWGGDDPSGFDCSGIINETLQATGIIDRKEDLTAHMLRDRFINNQVQQPYKGCLVLWYDKNNPENIIHVEMCINSFLSIGASGGGSKTLTIEDAIKDNAFIKIRPFASRLCIWGFVDPFI